MNGEDIGGAVDDVLDLYFMEVAAYWILELGAQRFTGSRTMASTDRSMLLILIPFWVTLIAPLAEHALLGTNASVFTVVAGGALMVISGAVRAKGIVDMAGRFSMAIEDTGGLVDTGIFAHVHHPLYLGNLLIFLGCPLMMGATWSWSVAAIGTVGIWMRVRREERFLIDTMPEYAEYMARTREIVPGLL